MALVPHFVGRYWVWFGYRQGRRWGLDGDSRRGPLRLYLRDA